MCTGVEYMVQFTVSMAGTSDGCNDEDENGTLTGDSGSHKNTSCEATACASVIAIISLRTIYSTEYRRVMPRHESIAVPP